MCEIKLKNLKMKDCVCTYPEKPREDGLAIWDEASDRSFCIGQCGDDAAERQEAFVDADALFQAISIDSCVTDTFTACQVDEADFAAFRWRFGVAQICVGAEFGDVQDYVED